MKKSFKNKKPRKKMGLCDLLVNPQFLKVVLYICKIAEKIADIISKNYFTILFLQNVYWKGIEAY